MANFDQPIIKPKRLSSGDVIGVAAPAGRYNADEFAKGTTIIRDMGFQVNIPEKILQPPNNFLAGTDEHRSSLLMDLFTDPEVDAIVCIRGGYGSLRILERLEYNVIRRHPKPFVGFSDISALHTTLISRAGLMVLHGPMVNSLVESDQRTRDSFLQALTTDQLIELKPDNPGLIYSGNATGVVAGGNLATLCHLLGTPFAPIYKGNILLLEDVCEAPYKIDRMLHQMKLAGCFTGIAGVFLGRFHKSGSYQEIYDIVGEIFADFNVPVLAGFEIGHYGTNVTIPLGIPATLDTEKGSLIFHEPATLP